jgi:hypothetical protein
MHGVLHPLAIDLREWRLRNGRPAEAELIFPSATGLPGPRQSSVTVALWVRTETDVPSCFAALRRRSRERISMISASLGMVCRC